MDFVYDLKEKLDKQDMEYAICIMKPTQKQENASYWDLSAE